jgi:hypothetical protein
MRNPFIVYGLIDPASKLIFYIGCTTKGLQRPKQHRLRGIAKCREYIVNLQRAGLEYEIAPLESVNDPSALPDTERWWIAYGKCCGWPLTNQRKGGELNVEDISDRLRAKRKLKENAAADFERDRAARALNLCMLVYEERGAEAALEDGRRLLPTSHLEWLEVVVVQHYPILREEPFMHLICPCGYNVRFHDTASMIAAVHHMNGHFRKVAARRKTISEPDMGSLGSFRWQRSKGRSGKRKTT